MNIFGIVKDWRIAVRGIVVFSGVGWSFEKGLWSERKVYRDNSRGFKIEFCVMMIVEGIEKRNEELVKEIKF